MLQIKFMFSIFLGIVLGYPFVFYCVGISDVFKEGFYFCVKYLTAPYLIFSLVFLFKFKAVIFESKPTIIELFIFSLIIPFTLAFLSLPYILLLNTIIPPQKEIDCSGIVETKYISKQRFGRNSRPTKIYNLLINLKRYDVERSTDRVRLPLDKQEYNKFHAGDFYVEKFIRGGLGITYTLMHNRPVGHAAFCRPTTTQLAPDTKDADICIEDNWKRLF